MKSQWKTASSAPNTRSFLLSLAALRTLDTLTWSLPFGYVSLLCRFFVSFLILGLGFQDLFQLNWLPPRLGAGGRTESTQNQSLPRLPPGAHLVWAGTDH